MTNKQVRLISKREVEMRKIFNEENKHDFNWDIKVENHRYQFTGCRGDASEQEVALLVAKFLQAESYTHRFEK